MNVDSGKEMKLNGIEKETRFVRMGRNVKIMLQISAAAPMLSCFYQTYARSIHYSTVHQTAYLFQIQS